MIQTYSGSLAIYFGNKEKQIDMKDIKRAAYVKVFQDLTQEMKLDQLVILDQQHTSIGFHIDDSLVKNQSSLYEYAGDFLITSKKRCGLIVLTADCLPVVMHDTQNDVVGIAHAGWKGSSLGIVEKMFSSMQKIYNSSVDAINVYYGNNAQTCCYEVGFEFLEYFASYEYGSKAFIKRNNTLYFDNKKFTTLQLQKVGIPTQNIYNTYKRCTICCLDYCSARREKEQAGRQVTVAALV